MTLSAECLYNKQEDFSSLGLRSETVSNWEVFSHIQHFSYSLLWEDETMTHFSRISIYLA